LSFTDAEEIKIASKALIAGVKDADPAKAWYESVTPNAFVSAGGSVWTDPDLSVLLANPAVNITTAQTLASVGNPLEDIVQDLSVPANSIRLTPVPGTAGTYMALSTYGDFTSSRLNNWILPQFVPLANGLPSTGYTVRLFEGDPGSGGTEVFTTTGTTGTGANKKVAWFWDYATGILLLSSDFSVANPYVMGFRYIGSTAINTTTNVFNVFGDAIGDIGGNVSFVDDDLIGNVSNVGVVAGDVISVGGDVTIVEDARSYDQPLTGVIDGFNTVFTSTVKWQRDTTIKERVYLNGASQKEGSGNDYEATESIATEGYDIITFSEAPQPGDIIIIDFTPVSS